MCRGDNINPLTKNANSLFSDAWETFINARSKVELMDLTKIEDVDIEIKQISDKDYFPGDCVFCGSEEVICRTHTMHDLWDLGSPGVARVLRHKKIRWECKICGQQFYILNPKVPFNASFTDEVKEYAIRRILKKGDSMNRVANDLNEIHNVKIHVSTISNWIADLEHDNDNACQDSFEGEKIQNSGMLSLDGTFKSVKSKKNDRGKGKDAHSWLHLTRSKDGRLVAVLPLENVKTS